MAIAIAILGFGLLVRRIEHFWRVSLSSCREITQKKIMRNFREMIIWNQGIALAVKIYAITKKLPAEERFGLTSQLNRAAVSIPSNIAEGCSRKSEKDFARFLEHSLGSAYEVETDLVIAEKIGYIKNEIVTDCLTHLQQEQRQIHSLIET
jgi:four helix bundle protein